MGNDYSQMHTHRDDNIHVTTGAMHPIKEWTVGVPVEEHARKQLFNLAQMPFIHRHVAAMPDIHVGTGATVGSVIATDRVIIPAACGVDIGCGMVAAKTTLRASHLPDNLAALRSCIEEHVPHGRSDNGGANDEGAWTKKEPPGVVGVAWMNLESGYKKICDKHPKIFHRSNLQQLGTLGTGNHFIELCLDDTLEQNVWVMLHSGSRGPGNKIGQYFIEKAKEEMRRWYIDLPDTNLAYLPEGSEYFDDYVEAVRWGQEFARENRELMLSQVLLAMKKSKELPKFEQTETAVNCHHNYVTKEFHFGKNVWVTRKGAVCARKGVMGIIPGSMGAKSFIVSGKGNLDSFHSCSHGAGRRMSRTEAKSTFTLKDHRAATEGIECRKDKDVIDETPGAYKDIDAVMAAQQDLVNIETTLKQVLVVKG
jgi:tRNA-splicing ligase RtcB